MAIEGLILTDEVTDSTKVAVNYRNQDYAVNASTFKDYVLSDVVLNESPALQYEAPSSNGFSVSVNDTQSSIWLILTPLAGYAAGTIVLPLATNCVSGQELVVTTTQAVTTLTINANGGATSGAPTTLAAGGFFRLKFEPTLKTWYRIG